MDCDGYGAVLAIAVTDDVLRIVDVINDDLMTVCIHLHGISLEH